jgi:hypothetical protein
MDLRKSSIVADSGSEDLTPSESSRSSVSFNGVPEADLEYLEDQTKAEEIIKRRNMRRKGKMTAIFHNMVRQTLGRDFSSNAALEESEFDSSIMEALSNDKYF